MNSGKGGATEGKAAAKPNRTVVYTVRLKRLIKHLHEKLTEQQPGVFFIYPTILDQMDTESRLSRSFPKKEILLAQFYSHAPTDPTDYF